MPASSTFSSFISLFSNHGFFSIYPGPVLLLLSSFPELDAPVLVEITAVVLIFVYR